MSPTSAIEAGKLGARLMSFAGTPWEIYKETHPAPYKEAYRAAQRKEPGPLVLADNMIMHGRHAMRRGRGLRQAARPSSPW